MKHSLLLLSMLALFWMGCQKEDKLITALEKQERLIIDSSSLIVNPSGYCPLSSILRFTSSAPGKIQLNIKGKNGTGSDIDNRFDEYGTEHAIPMGLYADYENTITVSLVDLQGNIIADRY